MSDTLGLLREYGLAVMLADDRDAILLELARLKRLERLTYDHAKEEHF